MRAPADKIKQVADPTRASIILLLTLQDELNVSELCTALGEYSQPAVSHHLALLRHSGAVEPRRDGKNNYYALTETGRRLGQVLMDLTSAK